jgi:transposase
MDIQTVKNQGWENWQSCGEHTGLYSRGLSCFLTEKQLFIRLENLLQIKACSGIKRAKTDRIDARTISRYVCRYSDRAVAYRSPEKEIDALQLFVSYRGRLVKNKVALEVAASEMRRVIAHDTTVRFVFESSMRDIEHIKNRSATLNRKCIR